MVMIERPEKLLPQNVDAEASLLGSILIDPAVLLDVMDLVGPEDFYREAHRTIYTHILLMVQAHEPVDLVTLADDLQRTGSLDDIGGISFLSSLANQVPSSRHAVRYAQIVERTAVLRRLIEVAGQIAGIAYNEPNAEEAIATVEVLFQTALLRNQRGTDSVDVADAIDEFLAQIEESIESGVQPGIKLGFRALDEHLMGLLPAEMLLICGRPGCFKSTLGATIADYVAEQHGRVEWVSLEMSHVQQAKRLITAWAGIDGRVVRAGFRRPDGTVAYQQFEQMKAAALAGRERLRGKLGLYTKPMTITQLCQHARRAVYKRGMELLIVDYIGLVSGDDAHESEYQRMTKISKAIKQLALELKIPIICLAQMNREVEKRVDKRPRMSDLRDSGSLEQDADIILGLHREANYEHPEFEKDERFRQLLEVSVLKARESVAENTTIPLRIEAEHTRATDWPADWPWRLYVEQKTTRGTQE